MFLLLPSVSQASPLPHRAKPPVDQDRPRTFPFVTVGEETVKRFPAFPISSETQREWRVRFLSVGIAPWVFALTVPRLRSKPFNFYSSQLDLALSEIRDPRVRRWAVAFTNRYYCTWMTFHDKPYGSFAERDLRCAAERFFRPLETRIISRYGELLPNVALHPWVERLVRFAKQPGIHLTMATIVRRARSYRQLL